MRKSRTAFKFRTKLALALLLLFLLTVALLFAIDTYSEKRLIEQVENNTEAVTKAIEVASDEAQLSTNGKIDSEIIQDYADKLRQHGVGDIQILGPDRNVIASSARQGRGKKRKASNPNISITGTIGENNLAPSAKREYRLIMPIISGNQKVGYVTIDLLLDDYYAVISENFGLRVIAVAAVFGAGLILVLLLTRNFTAPIGELSRAAKRVADGDLEAQVGSRRSDDVGTLVATWNAMITRLKEQRVLEARLASAERNASLGHLVSGIAHEIRNPLNTIALAVDYLKRRFSPAEPVPREEFLQITQSLHAEITRLNALITDFLNYGKPLKLNPAPMNTGDLLSEVARELEPEASLREVAIDLHENGASPVLADRNLLKSAFLNVALNAVQMMPAGGRLTISAGLEENACRIRFDDTGPGISPDHLKKIFEPYFSTREGGVGLGLAMTHRIVTDHGGQLIAENLPSGGSRFEFILPVAV